MTIDPLVPVRITGFSGAPHLAWTEGRAFSVPWSVLEQTGLASRLQHDGSLQLDHEIRAVAPAAAAALRERAAFTDVKPASSRLPISYQWVPAWIRAAGASLIGRRQRGRIAQWARFPGWPLDLSADFVADLTAAALTGRSGLRTPVLLSHDIDSPEGLANLTTRFLPLEESVGARSVNYIVPCAWKIDEARLNHVRDRGHELGIHGYDHRNRTAFAPADERRRRLDAARPLIDRYGVRGYRAPSLLRTRALLRDLAGRYAYDSSIPTSGGLFPVPNNGCATARPFRIEGMTELPITMPRDGSLRFLGYRPEEIAPLWIECARTIADSRGVIVLLTHCEDRFSGTEPMLRAYRRFLDFVAESDRFVFGRTLDVLSAGES